MKATRIAVALLVLLGTGSFASAQELSPSSAVVATDEQSQPAVEVLQERPRILIPLYAMQITLNGLDVHSTLRALEAGHREANPLFEDGSARKMIGAKIASSTISVFLAEKLWKKNRVAAVVLVAGVNAALAAVVTNNYRLAASSPRRSADR